MIDREKATNKAYKVTDRKGYSEYSVIVFADTPGKAVSLALGTDEFPFGDWDFTQLKAIRIPALDASYRGNQYMDWYNMSDRIAMVKEVGFYCDPDFITLKECKDCLAKDWCYGYETMKEDAKENNDDIADEQDS